MKSQSLGHAVLAAALSLASSASWAAEPRMTSVSSLAEDSLACTDLPGDLWVAAQEAGVLIHAGQISTSTSDLVAASAGAIVGIEDLPASQYAQGVDVAFVYLNSPDSHIPAGYYRLTATAKASDIQVGTYTGTVGFTNMAGQEVARVLATFETTSLTKPPSGPFSPPRVTIQATLSANSLKNLMSGIVFRIWLPSGVINVPAVVL